MKLIKLIILSLVALLLGPSYSALADVGFQLLQIPDRPSESDEQPGRPDLAVALWYPSTQKAGETPNTPFGHALAVDAPLNGSANMPLVLLSHGYSGWYGGHADTASALALAGYIVAAPSHTGNHFADMTSPIEKWALDRPRHISATIDHLLRDSFTREAINPARIGVYGFSAGGFTALSLIGGVPDLAQASRHCSSDPTEFACAEGLISRLHAESPADLQDAAWGYDPRIRAAAIAAPGMAFGYSEDGLKNVQVPVQLWSALEDDSVPHASNAAVLAKRLPNPPQLHEIENAGHFAFLIVPCRPAFQQEDPQEYEMICGDKPGFDRHEFHRTMNAQMAQFFDEVLAD